MCDKHQIIEEPCEGKLSCTVLKTNGVGDSLVEFNVLATCSDGTKYDMPQATLIGENQAQSATVA